MPLDVQDLVTYLKMSRQAKLDQVDHATRDRKALTSELQEYCVWLTELAEDLTTVFKIHPEVSHGLFKAECLSETENSVSLLIEGTVEVFLTFDLHGEGIRHNRSVKFPNTVIGLEGPVDLKKAPKEKVRSTVFESLRIVFAYLEDRGF